MLGPAAALAAGLDLSDGAARILLLPVVPICLWVAWSDMARMKIPNAAVLALVAIFVLLGPIALPLPDWGWRWASLAIVLSIGFVLNVIGALGAGDAKFMAAAALFVAPGDAGTVAMLLATMLLAAFATHRLARAIPYVRNRTAGWVSWRSAKFPMGLALGPTLVLYLALAALS
ncbi:prepilin peptidase CpaA [Palleronia aestuarii]|uniref:Prepilin peptidase CpaA n=1 Tax=Palleronia aestuarii TaxID=568105 RepID=A0A2W7NST1_9RHOB|nr:prepilin peptidase [Palleronia aestuarii]PZX19674.1 prepilin peptidase CpaA [Palleronia aestuarii]